MVLSFAADAGAAAIPFGGGTSVVGGVEPRVGDGYKGSVSIDMRRLDRVLEVDAVSRAARIQAGALGPVLEEQLREHGLTLRHFPQSFEYSTLGGWIATRAGGHFATLYTHIDDLVESVRAVTPGGEHEWSSFRLPGSGAGPSPDRMLLGSEGILGVIVDAWMRVQERPTLESVPRRRLRRTSRQGAEAVRELSQSGLNPEQLPPARPGGVRDHRGRAPGQGAAGAGLRVGPPPGGRGHGACARRRRRPMAASREARAEALMEATPVGAWRSAFLHAPYLRDSLVACGVLSDTFETAITWDRFPDFHAEVMETARRAVASACGGPAEGPGAPRIGCRFTHVYPDGPAPYYTVLAKARRGSEVEQWDEVKAAVSETINDLGGTITHHHAVGRDHRPWYDRQRPDPFAAALRAAKSELDPKGILNPGVLIDPLAER